MPLSKRSRDRAGPPAHRDPLRSGGPARYFTAQGMEHIKLGLITPFSDNFCAGLQSDANHLRGQDLHVPRP
jgi:molybdenum cofactor biosynthesis enzyme MoaA